VTFAVTDERCCLRVLVLVLGFLLRYFEAAVVPLLEVDVVVEVDFCVVLGFVVEEVEVFVVCVSLLVLEEEEVLLLLLAMFLEDDLEDAMFAAIVPLQDIPNKRLILYCLEGSSSQVGISAISSVRSCRNGRPMLSRSTYHLDYSLFRYRQMMIVWMIDDG